jgi:cyanophycin synthetase
MDILERRVYRGPNLYALYPLIRFKIDLGELEDYPTMALPGFVERLLRLLPSLSDHTCSVGERGGFVRRMTEDEGTWLGHVMEHIALELQCLAGTTVSYGKTRQHYLPRGQYFVIYEMDNETVGLEAGELALRIIRTCLPADRKAHLGTPIDVQAEVERLARIADTKALGPSTAALVRAAEARDIPWMRLNEFSLLQLGYGRYQKRIQATVTSETRQIAVEIASDKEQTNRLLSDLGLPVPAQHLGNSADEAVESARLLGYPVVVKPLDANHGKGVSVNLLTDEQVRVAYDRAREHRTSVIVERYLTGVDHRILVVGGKVVACAQRIPGQVVGDGTHTVAELVERVNQDPRRGVGHEKILTRLALDEQALRLMSLAGVDAATILPDGKVLALRATGNLSTGGTAVDMTDVIHYENRVLAERAVRAIGLDVGGVDFITPDISRSWHEVGGGIVEVNAAPGFRMHVSPSEGKARDVAGPVIEMLFPAGSPSRVPIAAITGTNGKTTTARMTAHIMQLAGYTVGLTTSDGVYIQGELLVAGDCTGPWSARQVLRDPTIDCAVLETARGGILREGLGFKKCDVAAVMNVAADHLGIQGIDTLEELAHLKQVIVEVAQQYVVLNADDPWVAGMRELTDAEPIYFTMDPRNALVREHVRAGGRAFVREEGVNGELIAFYQGETHVQLLWTHLIPATVEGHARFNVVNAMAAAAVSSGLGVPLETVRQGLRTFNTSYFQTPGRLNFYDEHPFRVILDYAHNPHAMTEIRDFVRSLPVRGERICVLGAPGDRRDEDLRELGALAGAAFDRVFLREDDDLRGRQPGETAALLREGLIAAGRAESTISEVMDEQASITAALQAAQAGDLVMIFAEKTARSWKQVIYHGKDRKKEASSPVPAPLPVPPLFRDDLPPPRPRRDREN